MNAKMRSLGIVCLTAMFVLCGALPASANYRKRTPPKISPPMVPLAFIGSVTAVDTKAMTVTVNGACNNTKKKNAPSGTVTFKMVPSCSIKRTDGSSGSFNDLQTGQTVAISYASDTVGQETNYSAESIDLNAASKTAKTASKKTQ